MGSPLPRSLALGRALRALPENVPVKMELGLTQFADLQYQIGVNDPNPSNDGLDVWIMRACK